MSEQIKRFSVRNTSIYREGMGPGPDFSTLMVRADDHDTALAAKDARIAKLEAALRLAQPCVERDMTAAVKENFGRVGNDPWACAAVDARDAVHDALASQQQAEPLIDTSAWQSCNPGCDPEFNGEKSRHCSCEPAKAAIAEQQADPTMAKNANVAATPSEDGGDVPKFDRRAIANRVNRMCVLMAGANTLNAAEFAVEECQSELERIVAAKDAEIAHLKLDLHHANMGCHEVEQLRAELRAQSARQVGDEQKPVAVVDCGNDGWWADILNDVTVEVGQKLYAHPAALAPAAVAVVMPEYCRSEVIGATHWNAAIDEVARLNRHPIPLELLERVCAIAEQEGQPEGEELRTLLGK